MFKGGTWLALLFFIIICPGEGGVGVLTGGWMIQSVPWLMEVKKYCNILLIRDTAYLASISAQYVEMYWRFSVCYIGAHCRFLPWPPEFLAAPLTQPNTKSKLLYFKISEQILWFLVFLYVCFFVPACVCVWQIYPGGHCTLVKCALHTGSIGRAKPIGHRGRQ